MAELTSEQIDRAFHAYTENSRGTIADAFRAAAPFLQLPWDEPSEQESSVIHSTYLGLRLTVSFDQYKCNILSDFVRRRNAALMPKPVDPRRNAIIEVLKYYPDRAPEIADRILGALDEIK